ncbi:MAG TPA: LLM class flavin-dependent oxidoreductase [Acidimicrobiales bacterium]|nr:LLM class flavin-dependent oxidoreductase [Acidimicrobiales bacterium]
MKVGLVVLPTDEWPLAGEQFAFAEQAGFASVWTYDHLVWGGMPDGPWHAAYPLLAAAAVGTSRVRLGTLVTSPNFRHPVGLAREVITLDHLSAGRFELGIGAGSVGPDAEVLGGPTWSAAERAARFAEFVELLDVLLREPVTDRTGTYYSATRAVMVPGCVQSPRVPFTVAATGRRSLDVVARLGHRWVTTGPTGPGPHAPAAVHDAVARQSALLDEACAAVGRDPATIGRVLLLMAVDHGLTSPEAFDDLAGRYGELGIGEIVLHHPRQTGPFGGDIAVFEEIARRHADP